MNWWFCIIVLLYFYCDTDAILYAKSPKAPRSVGHGWRTNHSARSNWEPRFWQFSISIQICFQSLVDTTSPHPGQIAMMIRSQSCNYEGLPCWCYPAVSSIAFLRRYHHRRNAQTSGRAYRQETTPGMTSYVIYVGDQQKGLKSWRMHWIHEIHQWERWWLQSEMSIRHEQFSSILSQYAYLLTL